MARLTVLICDDHTEFRASLAALLAGVGDIDVRGEADNGAAAVEAARILQPDVVLMDLTMPGMGGIEATRWIVQQSPHIGVVVLTMVEDDDAVFSAMQAGARGYLLKGARRDEIVRSVRSVADGDAVFGAAIAGRLMRFFERPRQPRGSQAFPQLTAREVQVLALMGKHLHNPAIAQQLAITEKTVRNNVSSILTKLCLTDRAQAIITAREAGLTE